MRGITYLRRRLSFQVCECVCVWVVGLPGEQQPPNEQQW